MILNRIWKGVLKINAVLSALAGRKLLDPIEVFFVPLENLVYPINSKSGNSSLKLKIIQQYNKEFMAVFPDIHLIDPFMVTDGKVQRKNFSTVDEYIAFCAGKRVRLVIRNPYERYYSLYLGVTKSRNFLYHQPSGTQRIFGITADDSFDTLLRNVCRIPDVIADRHFRSQSFYLPQGITDAAESISIYELKTYLRGGEEANWLNKSIEQITPGKLAFLQQHEGFQKRYKTDIELYRRITTLPISRAKN